MIPMSFKSGRGFTIIELILAVAITALLAACVFSATQSMTGTARRQTELGKKQTRRDRFEEIVRRDMRGWLSSNAISGTPPKATRKPTDLQEKQVLIHFITTADSLTSIQGIDYSSLPRSTDVQYVMRKVDETFEIDRIESFAGKPSGEVSLYRGQNEPKLEVFDGSTWLTEWTRGERPAAVKLSLDTGVILVKL